MPFLYYCAYTAQFFPRHKVLAHGTDGAVPAAPASAGEPLCSDIPYTHPGQKTFKAGNTNCLQSKTLLSWLHSAGASGRPLSQGGGCKVAATPNNPLNGRVRTMSGLPDLNPKAHKSDRYNWRPLRTWARCKCT